ncbi:hypothetical protein [Aeromicrobium wangtongii]|uniref:hypothetical protein n=1 Tax=Aeromicrobium wangtongii TaxID=2969247 RepID=UPI00201774F8|nr:hypothetical protein [Aeromicrobium wangtongii]MCL3818772.1 hypothetical protein [Aeromicrobium wangtongii]
MTTDDDRPDVDIAADPAIWLRGPSPEASDEDRREWLLGAQHAVSTDFDLENAKGGADYREYLSQVLKAFVSWQTSANVTFLRMRHQGDTPIPVSLELYSRTDLQDIAADPSIDFSTDKPLADQFVDSLLADPDDVPTVGETSCEPVGTTGWQRLVYWVEDPKDGVTGRVRYVRHFAASGVVAVFRFGGLDPALTIEALEDVDELAHGVRVGGES